MSGALTVDALLRAWNALPKVPRIRIIVGMPGLPEDAAFKRQSVDAKVLLIGRSAWKGVLRSIPTPPQGLTDPRELNTARLCGVPIEFFCDRADHMILMRDILGAIVRGKAIRVSLDEEFGNTDPRLPGSLE